MLILKKGHQPGVYVPLRALFLVRHNHVCLIVVINTFFTCSYIFLCMESNELRLRKPAFCICENKGADQLRYKHAIHLLPKSEISSL